MKRILTLSILLYLCCAIAIAQSVDSVQVVELHPVESNEVGAKQFHRVNSSMPQGVWITTIITTTATFITIITGIVFMVWFVRDIRKENSKNIKIQTKTLERMEKGQKEGFENQLKSLENIQQSLEIQTKSLERINESAERQIKILERIEAK